MTCAKFEHKCGECGDDACRLDRGAGDAPFNPDLDADPVCFCPRPTMTESFPRMVVHHNGKATVSDAEYERLTQAAMKCARLTHDLAVETALVGGLTKERDTAYARGFADAKGKAVESVRRMVLLYGAVTDDRVCDAIRAIAPEAACKEVE